MTRVYFTDRDLGNTFPDILANAGLRIERHRDHFPPDCRDEQWLSTVGKLGWVALTHDARIRYKPNELAAVVRHRVSLLVLVGKARFPGPLSTVDKRRVMPGTVALWYRP